MELGDLEEARQELDFVLEKDPGFTGARLRLGIILRRLGDDEGAIACWERCAEERPDDFRPKAYLASIRGAQS